MTQHPVDVHPPKARLDLDEWFQTPQLLKLGGLLYLLRVPILLFLAVAFMTWGGLSNAGPGAMILEGIYDVAWLPTAPGVWPNIQVVVRFLLLSLAALSFAITLATCARNTLRCAERFDVHVPDEDTPRFRGIRLLYTIPPLLLALTIIIGVTVSTPVSKVFASTGDLLGALAFALFVHAGERFRRPNPGKFLAVAVIVFLASWNWLLKDGRICMLVLIGIIAIMQFGLLKIDQNPQKWIVGSHAGYIKGGRLMGQHLAAAHAFSLALMIYGSFFILKSLNTKEVLAEYPVIPTLSVLLILGMLTCWTFSGIAFFFDHYRIPLIIPIVIYGTFTSFFPQSDHFYQLRTAKNPVTAATPSELLADDDAHSPIVLVSITGGGIRASAWSARVLRELQWRSDNQDTFLQSIRLISSVSGGSIGAMYFANAYGNSERTAKRGQNGDFLDETDPVLTHAEASSLDDIAVQLAYQDTLFGLMPFVRGLDIDLEHRQYTILNGPQIFKDRGGALEDAIKRGPQQGEELGRVTLNDWRLDTKNRKRPAIIMNASVVESGRRLLFSTTDIPTVNSGRVFFSDGPEHNDVLVATAARMSATFPYVSPAARPILNNVRELSNHAVDGGYTDNYGMASLVEWLNCGLSGLKSLPKRVLIIEIRSSPADVDKPHDNQRGFVFQTLHPLLTLANSRDTGQLSHNNLERDLVRDRWLKDGVQVCSAIFQTPADNRLEPLNWHLTADDIGSLRNAWKNGTADATRKVIDFFRGGDAACQP